jgi:succinate-semialdehyde dehydrogenase/glutarate-semialdehyde dehydrogenase
MSTSFTSINPATNTPIASYNAHTDAEVDARLQRAYEAAVIQASRPFKERAARLHALGDALEARSDEWAALMTREMGKPLSQAKGEAEKCAWVCRHYAEHGADILSHKTVATDAQRSYVRYEPLGPVLAIMPWNYPFWQCIRFGAPALMAGNTMLLKHAPNTMGCAEAIEQICIDAGFDSGEVQTLRINEDTVSSCIADRRVRAVTLTGSVGAGQDVAQQAAAHVKPTVLELGGSDPFIVLADADLDAAVETAVQARMQNNGQSCIAAKRFIVEAPIADAFTERVAEAVDDLTVGDPTDPATDIGPMARADLHDTVRSQVDRAVNDGATIAAEADVPADTNGFYMPPTVLTDVIPGSVAFNEEIFGPVASVVVASDTNDAVELANNTRFGLGGAVFTRDIDRGEQIAQQLEVGCAFVNSMVKSDPRLPFGGVKDSGYGRELGAHGIREFVNVKTVWVA